MSTQKTETDTKTEPKTPPFDPTAAWATSQQAFHKMMTEALERTQALSGEYVALEAQMIAKAREAIAHWAQLAQDAITYSAQLSAQARKLGTDAVRKMGVA
jgi:hypothetical protein